MYDLKERKKGHTLVLGFHHSQAWNASNAKCAINLVMTRRCCFATAVTVVTTAFALIRRLRSRSCFASCALKAQALFNRLLLGLRHLYGQHAVLVVGLDLVDLNI